MCGIAGGAVPRAAVERALGAIAHRGPDSEGIVEACDWVLGHRRLAILDLDRRSDQPFRRGPVALSYNGELWNYRAIRADLEALGESFATEGDTEVLAAALHRWGTEALPRLNGMFAVAWIDERDGSLTLARDRFGEVPLHVGWAPGGGLAFGSELRAMRAMGSSPRSVRWVEPGSWLRLEATGTSSRGRYHALDLSPSGETLEQAATAMRRHLDDACRDRLIADVPVAVLVSGGIDSSAIAALLAPRMPGLRAYTAVHDPRSLDRRCAREVCERLGIELVEVPVPSPSADDLGETVGVIEHHSKAQTEIAWACRFLARRLRADGVKVVFSGEGSDELWAAYNNSFFGIRKHPGGWHGYRAETFVAQHRKNFPRCNKVFMAEGIEARLPFLHPALVEWGVRLARDAVFGLPPSGVTRSGKPRKAVKEKSHLRLAFRDLLPRRVIERDKEAFQTGAGLNDAAARAVASPIKFYRSEFRKRFGEVEL